MKRRGDWMSKSCIDTIHIGFTHAAFIHPTKYHMVSAATEHVRRLLKDSRPTLLRVRSPMRF